MLELESLESFEVVLESHVERDVHDMRTFLIVHDFQKHDKPPDAIWIMYVREESFHRIVNVNDDLIVNLFDVGYCS